MIIIDNSIALKVLEDYLKILRLLNPLNLFSPFHKSLVKCIRPSIHSFIHRTQTLSAMRYMIKS